MVFYAPSHTKWLTTDSHHLRDPEPFAITAVSIDMMTVAYAIVQIPAQIGPNQHGSLRCKVDTNASTNVMPLPTFAKLFPMCISTDGRPSVLMCSMDLHPSNTCLTAYNGSTIPELSTLDTAIEWKPKGHTFPNGLHTWWYVADTPAPAILGLPSFSKLGIVQLNCAVQFTHRQRTPNPVRKPTTEQEKDWHNLTHLWENCMELKHRLSMLQPLNSWEGLLMAHSRPFKDIGQFHVT